MLLPFPSMGSASSKVESRVVCSPSEAVLLVIEGACFWWLGARMFGEEVLKFFTKFKRLACSRVLLATSIVLFGKFEIFN